MKKIVCLKHGNKYDSRYVNILHAMCKKHSTIPFEMVCITDNPAGLNDDIKVYKCPDWGIAGDRKAWWYKVFLFSPKFQQWCGDEFIFFDLDVVIFNNIDKLWSHHPNTFVVIHDFNRCRMKNWKVRNSSVMKFGVNCENQLWEKFNQNHAAQINRMQGDQDYVTKELPESKMWPADWVMSYKWEMGVHVRKPEFGQRAHIIEGRTEIVKSLTVQDGKKIWTTEYKKPKITEHTCVAVFHGRPNPEQCLDDPLVAENWRL